MIQEQAEQKPSPHVEWEKLSQKVTLLRQRVEEAYYDWCAKCDDLRRAEEASRAAWLRLFDDLAGRPDELGD